MHRREMQERDRSRAAGTNRPPGKPREVADVSPAPSLEALLAEARDHAERSRGYVTGPCSCLALREALRRSELVALEVEDVALCEEGLVLTIHQLAWHQAV